MSTVVNFLGGAALLVAGGGVLWWMRHDIAAVFGRTQDDEANDDADDAETDEDEAAEADPDADRMADIERLEGEVLAMLDGRKIHPTQRDRLKKYLRDHGYYWLSRERYQRYLTLMLQRSEEAAMLKPAAAQVKEG